MSNVSKFIESLNRGKALHDQCRCDMCYQNPHTVDSQRQVKKSIPENKRRVKREVAYLDGVAEKDADLWFGKRKIP